MPASPILTIGRRQAVAAARIDLHRLVQRLELEIPVVLVGLANSFLVFFELGLVVGLAEEAFKQDRVRNAEGMEVLHRLDHPPLGFRLIARDDDLPTFTFGPSLTSKVTLSEEGGILLYHRVHGRILAAALGQEFLQYLRGVLNLVGIVLRFDDTSPTLRS